MTTIVTLTDHERKDAAELSLKGYEVAFTVANTELPSTHPALAESPGTPRKVQKLTTLTKAEEP